MIALLAAVEARGTAKVHLTPGEVNAIWHLTQYIGRSFWHLAPWAQCVAAGVPGLGGTAWLWRWDALPLATDAEVRRWNREVTSGRRRH